MAGQIARLKGAARVIGSAGSRDKAAYLTEKRSPRSASIWARFATAKHLAAWSGAGAGQQRVGR
jgi:NADPH-dependent curcumin reductase CurA